MSENMVEPDEPQITSKYEAYALHAGYARLHARSAYTRPRARAPTLKHAHAQAEICNSYCFSSATMIRERASMLRYTYLVCLV